jgi:hypothetical protein
MTKEGSIRIDYPLLYSSIIMAILIIGVTIFCSTYGVLVIFTSKISDILSMLISIGIMVASCLVFLIVLYFVIQLTNIGNQVGQEATFLIIILVAVLLFLGIVLSLSGIDFNDVVKNKEVMSQHYFYAFSIATIIFITITFVVFYCVKREMKKLKDVNTLFSRYNHVYEKMPNYAKKSGIVRNEHGVGVIAEDEFESFLNRYYLICDLPHNERDPKKWNKKNIGRYFSA